MKPFSITVPGFPRVGARRAYKTLLEKFWSGVLTQGEFDEGMDSLRRDRLTVQANAGLDLIPAGDFSLYDHVLDTALTFGCLPVRFKGLTGHDAYFAAARGKDGLPAQEMTKWFDTNYHYLVPELPDAFQLVQNRPLEAYRFARSVVGDLARPVLVGPFTFLKLARLNGAGLTRRLHEILPLYREIADSLVAEGAPFVTLDESALSGDLSHEELEAFLNAYRNLGDSVLIQTAYGDVAPYWSRMRDLPVAGFGLDFCRHLEENLQALHEHGYPAGKLLIAGVVDGRNVWRTDLEEALTVIQALGSLVDSERFILSASCSLLHLPETAAGEDRLPEGLRQGLCFARERLAELALLGQAATQGKESVNADWDAAQGSLSRWKSDASRFNVAVQARVAGLTAHDEVRIPYEERLPLQAEKLKLPLLPTTTIGSFPQTAELRKARAVRKHDENAYEQAIKAAIESVVLLQEEIGLDVLVHGEPERNDMVQFFGDQMEGFATTKEGWVQSYGSRCVRPPIIFGDIERKGTLTVKELAYAQSLTQKPMKGMLTGPITILKWSFIRDDVPISTVANQIALAIRDEVSDLEVAGIGIVQIDEAAYREALPLRRELWPHYVAWAVRAFRIASCGSRPETQIHTHMCYSEFGDMIEAIAAMDADVISIEDARSDGALLDTLREFSYPLAIGPGVYDIHSPNVPDVEFIESRLRSALGVLRPNQVWVNPDCGLKTRSYSEVVPSLKNMVAAAKSIRAELSD